MAAGPQGLPVQPGGVIWSVASAAPRSEADSAITQQKNQANGSLLLRWVCQGGHPARSPRRARAQRGRTPLSRVRPGLKHQGRRQHRSAGALHRAIKTGRQSGRVQVCHARYSRRFARVGHVKSAIRTGNGRIAINGETHRRMKRWRKTRISTVCDEEPDSVVFSKIGRVPSSAALCSANFAGSPQHGNRRAAQSQSQPEASETGLNCGPRPIGS